LRDDAERIRDMLTAIDRIEERAYVECEDLQRDELIQVWMLHHLMLLGEAARAVSPGFRAEHPTLPWQEMQGMRSIVVHQYFGIDLEVVWSTIHEELPGLKEQLGEVLDGLESTGDGP
jgi:uncharacterized protein with HEPN domain